MSGPGIEGRSYRRVNLALQVTTRLPGHSLSASTTNLSFGGFAVAGAALPRGTQALFELELPPGRGTVVLCGEVIWSREEGGREEMGVRLVNTEGSARQQFDVLVSELLNGGRPPTDPKPVIRLCSNENPIGPSPMASAEIAGALHSLNYYPDRSSAPSEALLAASLKLNAKQVVVTPGSFALLGLLTHSLMRPGEEIIFANPSYPIYRYCALKAGAIPVEVPLTRGYRHDLEGMLAAITPSTRIIVICNPNNPTGTAVTDDDLDSFVARVPDNVLIVIDEAYFEYATGPKHRDAIEYVRAGKNVLVLRSFSKCYGLGGLRIGYGVGQFRTAGALRGLREPFVVNALGQAAIKGALLDHAHLARVRRLNEEVRERIYQGSQRLGLEFIPSVANFVMLKTDCDDIAVVESLSEKGVLVRGGTEYGMPGWIRVTTGTHDSNERFLVALEEVLHQLRPAAAPPLRWCAGS